MSMRLTPELANDPEIPLARFVDRSPRLLPGEKEADYWAAHDLIQDDLAPVTNMERLVMADLAGLFWDIQRYRDFKDAILAVSRQAAIESALQQTHFASAAPKTLDMRIIISRQEGEQWRTDPDKRQALEARLKEHGYDDVTLNAGALLEALVPLAAIDRLLSSARAQFNMLLKEVYVRREFADRARKALHERLQAPKPKLIANHG